MKKIFFTRRVYIFFGIAIFLFVMAGVWRILLYPALFFSFIWPCILILEWIQLNRYIRGIAGKRIMTDVLHLGDKQDIIYTVENKNNRSLLLSIYDNLPVKLQWRKSIYEGSIKANENLTIPFSITPVERGLYAFGICHVVVSIPWPGFIRMSKIMDQPSEVQVHPSVLQMKKYEMMVVSGVAHQNGIRRVRMIGENDEFEQIRPYAQGDNIKAINWKATARKQELLINTFHDSRSQEVYCIIDKGRTMEMPFHGMSLMDYAINTTLTFSNIVLRKFDKAGLITFADQIDDTIPASSQGHQLNRISDVLYNQSTDFKESDFQFLYAFLRKNIRRRSILFLFTNFEDPYEVERNIMYLRLMNKYHLLIIICFINEEIEKIITRETKDKTEIYQNVLAMDTLHKREAFLQNLTGFGIQLVMVRPKDLSIAVINKYLEIKSKRLK